MSMNPMMSAAEGAGAQGSGNILPLNGGPVVHNNGSSSNIPPNINGLLNNLNNVNGNNQCVPLNYNHQSQMNNNMNQQQQMPGQGQQLCQQNSMNSMNNMSNQLQNQNPNMNPLPNSGDDSPSKRYERIDEKMLGEGTYGEVYKVKDQVTGEILALKRMKLHDEEEGVPSTAIREISILKELPHRNVVQLRDVFCTKQKVMLVFEFVESDLKKFMKKSGGALGVQLVRDFSHQLLAGLDFMHEKRIIHRDLKPQNLLITQDTNPILKIADFGLARAFALPVPKYTHEVVTVWYRAPEILLGQAEYALPVDIWSCGCIIAEMGCGAALFMGDCEIDTIFKIFQKLGTPTYDEWPDLQHLRDFKPETFPKWRRKPWPDIRDLGKLVGYDCCDLLNHLLAYDPSNRCSPKRALLHAFFKHNGPRSMMSY